MKAFPRLLLVLAGALLVVQPALACHCLGDLLADAREAVSGDSSCHESPAIRHDESPRAASPQCAACGNYEPATSPSPATAAASAYTPEFNPTPAISGHPAASGRPQAAGNIGLPPVIPRVAPTPVLLKQRLLN